MLPVVIMPLLVLVIAILGWLLMLQDREVWSRTQQYNTAVGGGKIPSSPSSYTIIVVCL